MYSERQSRLRERFGMRRNACRRTKLLSSLAWSENDKAATDRGRVKLKSAFLHFSFSPAQ